MSNFVFRLFENLSLEQNDPGRFKLEIKIHRGAVFKNFKANDIWEELNDTEKHTMSIDRKSFVELNKKLTLRDVDDFFKGLESI
jgi:hypothetical protein